MGKQRTKTRVHQREHAKSPKTPEFSVEGPEVAPPPFAMETSPKVSPLDISGFINDKHGTGYDNDEEKIVEKIPVNDLGNPIFGSPTGENADGAHVKPESLTQIPKSLQTMGEDFSAGVDFESIDGFGHDGEAVEGFSADPESENENANANGEGGAGSNEENPESSPVPPTADQTGPPAEESGVAGAGGEGGAGGGMAGGQQVGGGAGGTGGGGGAMGGDLFSSGESVSSTGSGAGPQQALVAGPPPQFESGESGSAAVQAFLSELTGKRSQITSVAESKKSAIRSAASAEKAKIQSSLEAKASALEAAYQTTLQQITSSAQEARSGITSGQTSKVSAVQAEATAKLGEVDALIQEKKTAIIQAGETKAKAAIAGGDAEAARASQEIQAKALQAMNLGAPGKFSGFERAERITAVVGKMASEASNAMLKAGQQVMEAAKKDAGDLAKKFRNEAKDAAAKFGDGKQAAVDKINQERDGAVEQINEAATEALAKVDEAESQATADLQSQQSAPQTIRQLASQSTGSIDQLADAACSKIDSQAQSALGEMDALMGDISSKLQGADEQQASEAIGQIRGGVDAQLSTFSGSLESATSGIVGQISSAGSDVVSRAETSVTQMQSSITETGSGFKTNVAQIKDKTLSSMEENVNNAKTEMGNALTTLGTELDKAINESTSTWESELTQGLQEIKSKVDKAIAEQDKVLKDLEVEINKKAQEIENESWLSRAVKFIGGMVYGFVKALVEMVAMILIIALVVLALVAVIAALIYLIGGLGALLAVILFIAANAALIGTIISVIGAILTVVGLAIAAYNIYQSITRTDLSDFERGSLAGQGLFDIVETFFGGKIISGLGDLAKGVNKVDNVTDAAKLGDVSDAGKLGDLGDAGKIDAPNAGNVGDAGKVDAPNAGNAGDAGKVDAPNAGNAGDAGKVEAPTTKADAGDAGKVEAPTTKADAGDAGKVEAPTTKADAGDAGKVESPTTKVDPSDTGKMDPAKDGGKTPESMKPVSGRGRRGGQRLKKKDIARVKKNLEAQGVEVQIVAEKGDAVVTLADGRKIDVPAGVQAGFQPYPDHKVIILRENATQYELFHEMMHLKHSQDIGIDEYLKLSMNPKGEMIKETRVFDMIMENKHMFTEDELKHAVNYINDVRKRNGQYPIDVDLSGATPILKERPVNDLFNVGKDAPKKSTLDDPGNADLLNTPKKGNLDAMPDGAKPTSLDGPSSASYDQLTASGMKAEVDGDTVKFMTPEGAHAATMQNGQLSFTYAGYGGDIVMDPNKTTTFLGKFNDSDRLDAGTRAFLGDPNAGVVGLPEGSFARGIGGVPNKNGMNSLDLPQDEYMAIINKHMEIQKNLPENAGLSPDELTTKGYTAGNNEFWDRYNAPFLEDAFARGDNVRLISDPKTQATGTYARELDMINGPDGLAKKYGYYYDEASATYKKGSPNPTDPPKMDSMKTDSDLDNASKLDESGRVKDGPTGGFGKNEYSDDISADEFYQSGEGKKAADFYDHLINNVTDGSDVQSISANTGLPGNIIQRVRSHLFDEKHLVVYADENEIAQQVLGRFTPHPDIARLWQGGMEGTLDSKQLDELVDLVAHEYIESRLLTEGLPFRAPESVVTPMGQPSPGHAMGAHDMSYNTGYSSRMRGAEKYGDPTDGIKEFQWESYYGVKYEGPELSRDLSNLEEITEYIIGVVRKYGK